MGRHLKHGDVMRRPDETHGDGPRPMSSRGAQTRPSQQAQRGQPTESEHEEQGAHQDQTTLTDRIVQLVQQTLTERAGKPVTDLGKLARALRVTSEQLEGNVAAPFISKAADGLEHAVHAVQRDGREVVVALERFARDKPLAFCGGALAIGVGAGRFLKSSAKASSARQELESPAARASRRRDTALQQRGNES